MSRVKTLEGIMLEAPFDLDELRLNEGVNHIDRNADIARRAAQRVTASQVPQILGEIDLYNEI